MTTIKRRDFFKLGGLGAAAMAGSLQGFSRNAKALTPSRVIVIGGGFAGATAARYLQEWATKEALAISVTLIERNASYASPILSNLVLVGALAKAKLDFGYESLRALGITVLQAEVTAIRPTSGLSSGTVGGTVVAGGVSLPYDRLVIAPGIDFDYSNAGGATVAGLEAAITDGSIIPAWKGGNDIERLKQQLVGLPAATGRFLLTIPPKPYRCPPGPYERACVVADYLNKNKPGAKVTVLDANSEIQAEKHTFEAAFASLGVTYVPNANLNAVTRDGSGWIASTTAGEYSAQVLNVLPRQRAGRVLDLIPEVLNNGRFAPVHALTYESSVTGCEGIFIIGDAQGTGQPKAGHIGNGEAKVCADAIVRMLKNNLANTQAYLSAIGPDGAPPVVTNSACYSPIKASSAKTASYLTMGFRAQPSTNWQPVKIDASVGEAPVPSSEHFKKMYDWAENLVADTFGVSRNIG